MDVDFVVGDLRDMPLADNTFDTCIFLETLEHIYPEDVNIVLEEIKRIMKDKSHIIISTPRSDNSSRNLGEKQNAFDVNHVQFFYDEEDLTDLLSSYFEIIKIWNEKRENPGKPGERHDSWYVVLKVNKNG